MKWLLLKKRLRGMAMKRKTRPTTSVTMVCRTCGSTARRPLFDTVACRGTHETSSEPALCPKGHGNMVRKDGVHQTVLA